MDSKNTSADVTHQMLQSQAVELAQLSANVSTALNEIAEIRHYLHSDKKTNQKGTVELARDNEERIDKLEQREKIYVAKAGVLYSIGVAVGTAVVWMVTKFFIK